MQLGTFARTAEAGRGNNAFDEAEQARPEWAKVLRVVLLVVFYLLVLMVLPMLGVH